MRFLLDISFATLPLSEAVAAGLVSKNAELTPIEALRAGDVGADDAALIASGEYGAVQETHRISPALAVIFDRTGPVRLRTPVRPDEIERTPVQLIDTTSSGELLARATLDPFFGITPAGYSREPIADAQAAIVEGVAAMMPPEAGFDEDLVRAWYILTAEAYVSHVLVVPAGISHDDLAAITLRADTLRSAAETGRRAVRNRIATATGVDRERLLDLYQATRWTLEEPDRRALLLMLQLGNKLGDAGPYVPEAKWLE